MIALLSLRKVWHPVLGGIQFSMASVWTHATILEEYVRLAYRNTLISIAQRLGRRESRSQVYIWWYGSDKGKFVNPTSLHVSADRSLSIALDQNKATGPMTDAGQRLTIQWVLGAWMVERRAQQDKSGSEDID